MTVLTDRQRATLRALCGAFAPGSRDEPTLNLPGVIEEQLGGAPQHLRAQIRQLLDVMGNAPANLVLAGQPRSLPSMTPAQAETYLQTWSGSRLELRRGAFMALKQLITFLFYAGHAPGAANPNWPAVGYPGPHPETAFPLQTPALEASAAGRDLAISTMEVASDLRLDADVCVIGSGAGGSVAAAALSQAGRDVVLLERGAYHRLADRTGDEYDTLQRISLGKGFFSTADNAFALLAATTLGGSTVVNWCTCLRPPADILDEWEREHGIDGLSGADFRDLLKQVEARLNVNTRESAHNPNNQALLNGARALGYRVETIARNVRGCGDCGPCAFGCPSGAKQDALMTYVRDAAQAGARIVVRCQADRILARNGRVTGVEATVDDPMSDRRHRLDVRCQAVVLAGGTIFSPTLLLRSGLGNALVGTGVRLHPTTAGLGVFSHAIELWKGSPQTAVCTEFARSAGRHGFWIEAAPAHPGLAASAVPWTSASDHADLMRRIARTSALIVLVRDHGSGRVTLTRAGDPVVRYRFDPRDRALMLRGLEEVGKIHLAAGAQEVSSLHTRRVHAGRDEPNAAMRLHAGLQREGIRPGALALFSAHLMGGLPMGSDRRRAAADPDGRLYGFRNLYVADASLFPSAPAVNPMITIMALAHRVAGRLLGDIPR